MKVLIIGLGSIAQKHIKALRICEPEVQITALRSNRGDLDSQVDGIQNIYHWDEAAETYDFILISNPTHLHLETIEKAASLQCPLFIEKPPFHSLDGTDKVVKQILMDEIPTYTAFNMRFLPVIQWLKENCSGKRVIEVQVYCGSYLPDWRPGRDYRKIYSADLKMGGGVHLDLIHEIDYVRWIFGDPAEVKSELLQISDLEIHSNDYAQYFFRYPAKVVMIMLNYYRRDPKRKIEIVFDSDTWSADLINGTVLNSKGKTIFDSDVSISDTYNIQMHYFLETLRQKSPLMNGLDESIKTLTLCLNK